MLANIDLATITAPKTDAAVKRDRKRSEQQKKKIADKRASKTPEAPKAPDAPKKKYVPRVEKPLVEAPGDSEVPEAKPATVFTAEKFSELKLNNKLQEILAKEGYDTLTSVQKYGVPAIIEHRNVCLKSETGSGKTMTYLVPLMEQLSRYSLEEEKISRDKGCYALIFSPTRELCV